MKQQTLAMAADQNAQYERYRRPTKRDAFLATMEQIVPWADLCSVIEPHYPRAGNGRPPVGLGRMLRMYFVQNWFNLADAACEDALLDSTALRRFVGIDLGRERVPDATTLLKFRRLLEKNKLGEALFAKVGEVLQANGLKLGTGTIVPSLGDQRGVFTQPRPRAAVQFDRLNRRFRLSSASRPLTAERTRAREGAIRRSRARMAGAHPNPTDAGDQAGAPLWGLPSTADSPTRPAGV